jgi:drug/metabolite transporter (DMT)-like permease
LFQTGYFVFLAAAYRQGDVSVAYPLVRATPILMLLLADSVRGRSPSAMAAVGIGLVVVGCFALPLKRLEIGPDGLAWRNYANRAGLWALAAAVGSAGYSLTDDLAIDLIQETVAGPRGAFLYECLEFGAMTTFLLVAVRLAEGPRAITRAWRTQRAGAFVVGAMAFLTYLLVLWAYAHAEKVAYVVAFRQFSVVLGVLGGTLLLKEPGARIRVTAAVVITTGLCLIGLQAQD